MNKVEDWSDDRELLDLQWNALSDQAEADAKANHTDYSKEVAKALTASPELYDRDVSTIRKDLMVPYGADWKAAEFADVAEDAGMTVPELWKDAAEGGVTEEVYELAFGTSIEDVNAATGAEYWLGRSDADR